MTVEKIMARGLPDHSRTVRPTYGGAHGVYDWKNCAPNAEISLLEVEGKGMTYGGYIRLLGVIAAIVDIPILVVDGLTVSDLKYEYLFDYGIDDATKGPLFLTAYDQKTGIYQACIAGGITFESKVELRYDSNTGVAKQPRYGFSYALI